MNSMSLGPDFHSFDDDFQDFPINSRGFTQPGSNHENAHSFMSVVSDDSLPLSGGLNTTNKYFDEFESSIQDEKSFRNMPQKNWKDQSFQQNFQDNNFGYGMDQHLGSYQRNIQQGGVKPRLQPTPQQVQYKMQGQQQQDPYGSSQYMPSGGYPMQGNGFQQNNYSRPPPLQQHQQFRAPHHQPYAPQMQPYNQQMNRAAPRPSQHKLFNQVHGSRQNLIHSGSGLAGGLRASLPHPPVVSEHTIVFMVSKLIMTCIYCG
jgi:hypothetical protein